MTTWNPDRIGPEDRDLWRATEERATKLFGHSFYWPYGPNVHYESRLALLDWAERYDLKPAPKASACLHWVEKGACRDRGCFGVRGRWMDHPSTWTQRHSGTRLLVSQPYLSMPSLIEALPALPEGVHLELQSTGWYNSATRYVGFWSANPFGLSANA